MTDNELANIEPKLSAADPTGLLAMAVQQGADASQLKELRDLHHQMERDQAEREFHEAMAMFQRRCPAIKKSRKGHNSNYAPLDDIMRQIAPLLQDCGLTITFDASMVDGNCHCVCRVRKGLHEQTTAIDLPMPEEMRVNQTQKMGAALSYAKRYSLCAALNITVTDEDTDGAGLGDTIGQKEQDAIDTLLSQLPDDRQRKFWQWATPTGELSMIPADKYKQAIKLLTDAVNGGDK
jgi:hypothetical protein